MSSASRAELPGATGSDNPEKEEFTLEEEEQEEEEEEGEEEEEEENRTGGEQDPVRSVRPSKAPSGSGAATCEPGSVVVLRGTRTSMSSQ